VPRGRKDDKAEKAYLRLYSPDTLDLGIAHLQETLEEERAANQDSNDATYLECFKGFDWRRTRIILWANFIQQFLGVTLIANSSYFLQLGGLSVNNSVMLIQITASLVLPGVIVSWFAMTMCRAASLCLSVQLL
jgi:SP family general alpha glucoside:H+ symporter-like MFS transporter